MKCFVTGGTGFVGANVVHVLVEQGHEVRVLARPGADARGLEGARCDRVTGDILDRDALGAGLRGCDWCFHVAASYHLWLPDYRPMYEANVEGTRRVLDAAVAAGCQRIVYTSTVGTIGLPKNPGGAPDPVAPSAPAPLDPNGSRAKLTPVLSKTSLPKRRHETVVPTDETAPATEAQMSNHYKRSKWRAEQVALEFSRRGAPVVIVNPSAPVGPRDVKPTPTGQVIVDFLNRKLPAYLDTGLNWVHVRDVAIGHILAAERGRIGERYILGHAHGNWTMRETLEALADLTGLKAPGFRVPYAVAWAAAALDEAIARVTRRPPKAPMAGVRMARYKMFFNPAKAIRELGLPQTPPLEAFSDAVRWFRDHGYATK